jgi:hypothetical protein
MSKHIDQRYPQRPRAQFSSKGGGWPASMPHTRAMKTACNRQRALQTAACMQAEKTSWQRDGWQSMAQTTTTSQHEKPSSQSGISSFLEGYVVSHIHIFTYIAGSVLWRYAATGTSVSMYDVWWLTWRYELRQQPSQSQCSMDGQRYTLHTSKSWGKR